jgi:hypothetical protein
MNLQSLGRDLRPKLGIKQEYRQFNHGFCVHVIIIDGVFKIKLFFLVIFEGNKGSHKGSKQGCIP